MSDIEKIAKWGVGLTLLWYGVLRGARGLMVGIKDYAFRNVDIVNQSVSFYLDFIIKNPLFVGLTLKSIKGDIYIQGKKAGYINTTVNYYLSGWHTHIVPVIVNLDLGGLGTALAANIMSGDVHTLTVAFDGKIYVGQYNVGVPVQINLGYNDLKAA